MLICQMDFLLPKTQEWGRIILADSYSLSKVSVIFKIWLDCHTIIINIYIYGAFGRDVSVCMSVRKITWKLL